MTLTLAVLPAGAAAQNGFDGTYSGESTEGRAITVRIVKGELKLITGAAILKLSCFRDDPSQPFPDDRTQLPDRNGEFEIETTRRSSVRNSQFLVGTPRPSPTSGDRVVNDAEGRFDSGEDRKPIIRLSMFYEEVTDSGSNGSETRCSGGSDAVLKRTSSGAEGRSERLRRPRGMRSKLTGIVPPLASIGDDGLGFSATTSHPSLAGGTIKVSIRRDRSEKDELRFGNGILGSESATVAPRRRRTGFTIDVKRPLRTPSRGDKVPMLVTVEFTDSRGRSRSATTEIVVK